MALADIRQEIADILGGVSGMGEVHQYDRFASSWDKFLELFKDDNDRINGWIITRQATPSVRDNIPTIQRLHRFIMRGFYGLHDEAASELTFQGLVEAIQDAFDDNVTLNNTVINSEPVQVEVIDIRTFGTVLCHYAELSIEAHERAYYTP